MASQQDNSEELSALELGSEMEDPVDGLTDEEKVSGYTETENDSINRNKVRKAVRHYGKDGITISEIVEATDLSRQTVTKHLDALRRLREVYRKKRNKQMYMYYPNGRPLHSYGKERVEEDDTILDIQLAKKDDDELFLHLTEKRFSLIEGESTEGAVVIPLDAFDEVYKKMDKLAKEVEE